MIDSRVAAEQLQRLSGLDYFPKEKPAQKELRLAIEVATTEGIAEKIISDWLRYSSGSPKPSELRHLLYEENERHTVQLSQCGRCGGDGFLTRWYLVTYKGNSFTVDKSERLDVANQEEASAFAARIAESPGTANQTVLSAAELCSCRKASVAAVSEANATRERLGVR